jgi:hypothetical protein
VAELTLDVLTPAELLELQHRREVVTRSLPTVGHQIINRLVAEADPKALGGYGWYGTPTARNTYSGGTSNATDRRGSRISTSSGMASL